MMSGGGVLPLSKERKATAACASPAGVRHGAVVAVVHRPGDPAHGRGERAVPEREVRGGMGREGEGGQYPLPIDGEGDEDSGN